MAEPVREDFTVGVEEEFLLVDAETRRLVPRAATVVPEARAAAGRYPPLRGRHGPGAQVEHELQLSQVETGTGVCRTLAEVSEELVAMRRAVRIGAERQGCRTASAGTYPLALGEGGVVTASPAYLRLERDYQLVAREQVVCGCHVHVGVNDPEIAIQVMNRARPWLAVLRALGVSSPFWMGEDSGYASFRTEIWSRWPTAGTPHAFSSRADYDRLVDDLLRTGAVDAPARIYWDLRPSARFDTLEFRVTDACMAVGETVMVAGLVRALVRTLHAQVSVAPSPVPRPELLRAASWRAARYGTEGELIDLDRRRSVPAAELVGRLLSFVRPALDEAGECDLVGSQVERVLADGTGAMRQRRAFARSGRLEDVVDLMVAETAAMP